MYTRRTTYSFGDTTENGTCLRHEPRLPLIMMVGLHCIILSMQLASARYKELDVAFTVHVQYFAQALIRLFVEEGLLWTRILL